MLSKKTTYLGILLLSIIGGVVIFFVTRFGVGISPDSTFYVSAAQNFKETGEFRDIWRGAYLDYMTHYPPGYSFFISIYNFLIQDVYQATRALNITLFAGLILILGIKLQKYLSVKSLIFLLVFVISSVSFINIFEMAWSECLFIPLSFLGLFYFLDYLETAKRNFLLLSAVFVAISIFTRYLGIVLPLTISFILLTRQESLKNKIKDLFLFNSIALSLLVFWFVRNFLYTSNSASRELSYHPMGWEYYRDLFVTMKQFFLQLRLPQSISIGIGAILLLITLIVFFRLLARKNREAKTMELVFVTYFVFMLAFLFVSNTFLDFTPLYFRILVPSILGLLIVIVRFVDKKASEKWGIAIFLVFLLQQAPYWIASVVTNTDAKEFARRELKVPETIDFVSKLDFNKDLVFSNEVDRLYYVADRTAYWVADLSDFDEKVNPKYVIIYKNGRSYQTASDLVSARDGKLILETSDAIVFQID